MFVENYKKFNLNVLFNYIYSNNKSIFSNIFKNINNIPNIILYSSSGTGKSSLSILIIKQLFGDNYNNDDIINKV
jgi:hypothetical protein